MAETARILERGYRAYEGDRGNVGAAMRTTAKHAVQRSLGLKRTAWQKVLPIVSIALAYIPAIVFVGLAALSERFRIEEEVGPTYAEYYGFVTAAILVFTSFVAPEVLCTDRRSGMLGLYLASPLTRNTYLAAKTLAVGIILSIVTIGPVLLVLLGRTLLGRGPDGIDGWFTTFGRILLAGFIVSSLHATLSLAIASMTSRRAVASASIVVVLVASAAAVDVLINAGGSPNLSGLHLFRLPFQLVHRVYGEEFAPFDRFDDVSTGVLAASYAGWTALFAGITWWRYRKLVVTR